MAKTIRKIGRHGGAGRGQGRKRNPNKRIGRTVYFPPTIESKIFASMKLTDESFSSTVVLFVDMAMSNLKIK